MELKVIETLKIKDSKDLEKAFDYVEYIELGDDYILFDDYSIWNKETDSELKFENANEVLNYKINDKKVVELLKDYSISFYE